MTSSARPTSTAASDAAPGAVLNALPHPVVTIDAQGKIVARNLRGEDLYKKVEELLGK